MNLVEGASESERIDELRFPWFRKTQQDQSVDLSRLDRKPQVATPRDEPEADRVEAPSRGLEIGLTFAYQGKTFIITGYMTELRKPGVFGRRDEELVACGRERATWVIGQGGGGSGTVAPIGSIRVGGPSEWSSESIQTATRKAETLVQKNYTIKKPLVRR